VQVNGLLDTTAFTIVSNVSASAIGFVRVRVADLVIDCCTKSDIVVVVSLPVKG
jgi:hypothetical protein